MSHLDRAITAAIGSQRRCDRGESASALSGDCQQKREIRETKEICTSVPQPKSKPAMLMPAIWTPEEETRVLHRASIEPAMT